eukprot:scaffold5091_cov165-Skeletonema_marinoi.AAC.3
MTTYNIFCRNLLDSSPPPLRQPARLKSQVREFRVGCRLPGSRLRPGGAPPAAASPQIVQGSRSNCTPQTC